MLKNWANADAGILDGFDGGVSGPGIGGGHGGLGHGAGGLGGGAGGAGGAGGLGHGGSGGLEDDLNKNLDNSDGVNR